MRTFAALLLKEESAIFTSPIAYVVLSVFLVIMGYTFTLTLFVSHVPTLVHLFFQIYVLFLLTVPIITMRIVAEERRRRTIEVGLTAPVAEAAVVFAKYLASLSLVLLMLVLSGAYAITLGILGRPDWGPIYSGYLGLFLLGAALVAVGLMTSSLVSNQIIAALLSLSLFLLLWIIDQFGWLLFEAALFLVALGLGAAAFDLVDDTVADALYFGAWCAAMLLIFSLALRLPLHLRGPLARLAHLGIVGAALGLALLANIALYRHDAHFDATVSRRFTP